MLKDSIFSGLMYEKVELKERKLTLELLKITDEETYERITSGVDSIATEKFKDKFRRKGMPVLKAGGFLILLFAFIHAIPLGLIFFLIMEKDKTEKEAEAEEKAEEEKPPAESTNEGAEF